MSKSIQIISFLLAICLHAAGQNRPATDSLVLTEFYSNILSENRRIIVHLPLNYVKEPTKKYPVMYVLDGGGQDIHTADKVATLAGAEIIPECIIVGILNTKTSRNRDQTPPYMRTETDDANSALGKADQFLAFIQKELVPKIDSNYRSNGHRTLSGHSRGGLFVLYAMMAKPDLFNARFCYSTPVWRFDDMMIKKIEDFAKEGLPENSFLFLSAGAQETENIVGGFTRLNAVLKKYANKSFKLKSHLTPLANHQQNPLFATARALAEWGKFYYSSTVKSGLQ